MDDRRQWDNSEEQWGVFMNFDKIQNRYIQTWALQNDDRPLVSIYAPKDRQVMPSDLITPKKIEDRWQNTEYVIKQNKSIIENTYYACDALPIFNPNLGPDILGAILGCELEYGETTSWAKNIVSDWTMQQDLIFDKNNKYYKKIAEITKAALEDSKGGYLVGITDLHSGLDCLVSLRGPENLCIDLIEKPDEVKKFTLQIFSIFKKVFNDLSEIIEQKQKGSTNWMGLWHPKRWYVTSCDFSCLISKDNFKEFILPELLAEIDFLDASVYHLDGPDALRHLDTLLEIPNLKGVQWVPGDGQKPPREWTDVLKRIQEAGKIVQINIGAADLKPICQALKPNGVMLNCYCRSEEEANASLKFLEDFYKVKI